MLVFGIGLIFSQLFSTFPLYMHSAFGFAENRIGQLLAINTIMIVLFEMVLLHSLKNVRPLKVIGAGALLTGLGFALTPLGRGFFYAALTVAVWTMGEMLSLPLLTAEISNRSSDQNRGRHMGLFARFFFPGLHARARWPAPEFTPLSPTALWFGCGGLGIILALGFQCWNEEDGTAAETSSAGSWNNYGWILAIRNRVTAISSLLTEYDK